MVAVLEGRMKKPSVSPQLKLQRELRRREQHVGMQTLFIPFHDPQERELLRRRIWYSGLSATYMASFMSHAALAAGAVMDLRGVESVTIHRLKSKDFDGQQFELRTRKKR